MKDNFSIQSNKYAKYRPTYPPALFEYLFSLIADKAIAWDCATGNGQIAAALSENFDAVYATDISNNQLLNAIPKENIYYSCVPAEKTPFADNSFNLITVGQAIHWFNFDLFYKEVYRTLKQQDGILGVIGYGLNTVDYETDIITRWFYKDIIGKYWDAERHYVEEEYKTIPFPFTELPSPCFKSVFEWTLSEYLGYIATWSAVQHYIKDTGKDPLPLIAEKLNNIWKDGERKTVNFPILLRIGRIA